MDTLNISRFEVISLLKGSALRGIELGVAKGGFSKRMVDSGRFLEFYGVDAYADAHDTQEYLTALSHVGITQNYKLLRMFFDDALTLFPDAYFDFIYIDGYAHTGEMGGETMFKWLDKLKPGGVIAGDDYDPERWPLVAEAVDYFASTVGGQLKVTNPNLVDPSSVFDKYPSWLLIDNGLKRGLSADPKMAANGERMFRRKLVSQHAKLSNPVVGLPPERFSSAAKVSETTTRQNPAVSKPRDRVPEDSKPVSELRYQGRGKTLVIVANGPTHKQAALTELKGRDNIHLMTINKPDDRVLANELLVVLRSGTPVTLRSILAGLFGHHDQYTACYGNKTKLRKAANDSRSHV